MGPQCTSRRRASSTRCRPRDRGRRGARCPVRRRWCWEDGRAFVGRGWGLGPEPAFGEVVFHTGMSGYTEILSDPSYAGQFVCFTHPHLGAYGADLPGEAQAARPLAAGMICRKLTQRPRGQRSGRGALATWLAEHRLPALEGIDTRALVRHLRRRGAMPAVLVPLEGEGLVDEARQRLAGEARDWGGRQIWDQARRAGCTRLEWLEPTGPWRGAGRSAPRVLVVDFGCKRGIVDRLRSAGCQVMLAPAVDPPRAAAGGAASRSSPPEQRPRRPAPAPRGSLRGAPPAGGRPEAPRPAVRHLPGPSAFGHGLGAERGADDLRPPRRQPSGARGGHRSGLYHQPEPQLLCRGASYRRAPRWRGDHPHQPLRRLRRGPCLARTPGPLRTVPPRGLPRPPRRRSLLRRHGSRPSMPGAASAARHREHPPRLVSERTAGEQTACAGADPEQAGTPPRWSTPPHQWCQGRSGGSPSPDTPRSHPVLTGASSGGGCYRARRATTN